MSRSSAAKRAHEVRKNPNAFCYKCTKRSVVVVPVDTRFPELGKKGLCYQHSDAGKAEAAGRAAVVKAAPQLLIYLRALLAGIYAGESNPIYVQAKRLVDSLPLPGPGDQQ